MPESAPRLTVEKVLQDFRDLSVTGLEEFKKLPVGERLSEVGLIINKLCLCDPSLQSRFDRALGKVLYNGSIDSSEAILGALWHELNEISNAQVMGEDIECE